MARIILSPIRQKNTEPYDPKTMPPQTSHRQELIRQQVTLVNQRWTNLNWHRSLNDFTDTKFNGTTTDAIKEGATAWIAQSEFKSLQKKIALFTTRTDWDNLPVNTKGEELGEAFLKVCPKPKEKPKRERDSKGRFSNEKTECLQNRLACRSWIIMRPV
ncbi:MAG: hypothetical protein Q9221_006481 [Calogaya cf. arnoldii]